MRGDAGTALSLPLAPADTFWALGSLCNLHRLPFDAGLLARAYPPPHTLATLVERLQSHGLRGRARARRRRARWTRLPLPGAGPDRQPKARGRDGPPDAARPALLVRVEGDRVLYFAAGANTPTVSERGGVRRGVPRLSPSGCRRPPGGGGGGRSARRAAASDSAGSFPSSCATRPCGGTCSRRRSPCSCSGSPCRCCRRSIIDKVIVHRATSTLARGGRRAGCSSSCSPRPAGLDPPVPRDPHRATASMPCSGSTVFRHLLALPLRYFEHRPTGVLTARLAGIEIDPRVRLRRGDHARARRAVPAACSWR